MINAAYFMWWTFDTTEEWMIIVNTGRVLALIGALVVLVSGIIDAFRK